jgi:flagellar biosynthesis protein FlhF
MSEVVRNAPPGSCFRFVVANAEEAARVIRDQLGIEAKVLSVRSVPAAGLLGFLSAPQIEVIAQLGSAPAPDTLLTDAAAEENPSSRPPVRPRRREPQGNLAELLRRAGFSPSLLDRLGQADEWGHLTALPLHRALAECGRLLATWSRRTEIKPLSRAAFLGSPGVGRTTALCKWLSAEVFQRARFGHVVTAEFDRPMSSGPLPVYCEALGVPLAHFPASTHPATPGGFVYFDLPGLAIGRRRDNAAIASFLAEAAIEERVLVLNAAYDHAALRAGYSAGRDLGATHVVFTHLDEVAQWGRLWDYVIDGGLEPLFLSTGPSLSGDLEMDAGDALARRTLPASEELIAPLAGPATGHDEVVDDPN